MRYLYINPDGLNKIKPGIKVILYKYVGCVFLLFTSVFSSAQKYIFKHYTVNDGLPHPYVYTINQGETGFLWIGTAEGLCRYDGKDFINYTTADGLAENFVNSSFVDVHDRQWFGHYQGGITLFDGEKFNIINKNTYATSRINKFYQSKNNAIWICTQNNGLLLIDTLNHISRIKEVDSTDILWDIKETNENKLLIATNNGLKILSVNPKSISLTNIKELADYQIINISTLSHNKFLIATEYDGLFTLTIEAHKFYVKKIKENLTANDKLIFATYDKNGNLWISKSESGLIKSRIDRDQLITLEVYNKSTGLNFSFIKSFFKDREGNMWFGTFGDGLYQLKNKIFSLYNGSLGASNLNNVKSLGFGDKNQLWLGTDKGIWLFNSETGAINEQVSFENIPSVIGTSNINAIHRWGNEVYIATGSLGVYKIDIQTKMGRWFYKNNDNISNKVNHIASDKNGNIWLATDNGAYQFEKNNNTFTRYGMGEGLSHNTINSLYIDSKNVVWFATYGSGITIYNNGKFKTIPSPLDFTGIDVNCFLEDKQGNMWVGTSGHGIYKITNGKFVSNLTNKDGLGSNFCYTLLSDAHDNLWIGHKNGLTKIFSSIKNIIFISNVELLQGAEINLNAVIKDNEKNIWYGTNKGLLKYDPSKDHLNFTESVTNFTALKIFFLEPNWKKLGYDKNLFSPPNNIVLPHNNNHLTFNFIGICLTGPEKVKYKYYLDGFDNSWSLETNETFTTYSNLPPGSYTFNVISTNNDGLWNSKPATYSFSIKPPFWKTWWFNIIWLFTLVLLILFIFKLRTQTLEKQKKTLEEDKFHLEHEVKQRKLAQKKLQESESKLLDTNKELNTLIWRSYHDLRGPLCTIEGLVNVARMDMSKSGICLDNIAMYTEKLHTIMKEFYEISKIKNTEIETSEIDFEAAIREVLIELSKIFNVNQFDVITDIKTTHPFYSEPNLLKILLSNLLNNAMTYTANYSIHIKIRQYKSQVKIIIEDDGIGIPSIAINNIFDMFYRASSSSKGNGLGLYKSKKITEILNGSIHIFSEENMGTTVCIRLSSIENYNLLIRD